MTTIITLTPDYSAALAILENCTHGPNICGDAHCDDCWSAYVAARDSVTKAARKEARKLNGPKPKARAFLPFVTK